MKFSLSTWTPTFVPLLHKYFYVWNDHHVRDDIIFNKKEFGIWEKEYEGDQDIRNESFFITAVNRKIKI